MTQKVIHTSGKRKRAIARATLTAGTGKILINQIPLPLFATHLARSRVMEPLILAGDLPAKMDIAVNVQGGGIMGQSDAARLAISRALVKHHPSLKKVFLEYDRLLLVADVRRKEACKPNDSKARKARQKSYR